VVMGPKGKAIISWNHYGEMWAVNCRYWGATTSLPVRFAMTESEATKIAYTFV
jgi:hypothetical protein